MNESLRPYESSGIDEALRIRLEGTIEVLEDALSLLQSVTYRLPAMESLGDDVITLQECVAQLPRIDEAIDKANRHQQATALTQAVGAWKGSAHRAANQRLIELGREEAPSLRAALSAVLALIRRQGTPPRPGELRLMESGGPPWLTALATGGALSAAIWFLNWYAGGSGGMTGLGALLGALACLIVLHDRAPIEWVLMPDRLYFPARYPTLAREFAPAAIDGLQVEGRTVKVQVLNETLALRSDSALRLFSLLRLLQSPWLAGVRSPPVESVVVGAVNDATSEEGRALICAEGVLFVLESRCALMMKALTAEVLPVELPLDEVLRLIAHLPPGRWSAITEHLEKEADAFWFPREEITVEENVVSIGEKRVRLMLVREPKRRLETQVLLDRLK